MQHNGTQHNDTRYNYAKGLYSELHFYIVVLRWCYVDGQNVTHQNVDGQNVDSQNVNGQNVDSQNVDGQNVALIEMSRLYLELTLSTLFIKCVISDSRHFGTRHSGHRCNTIAPEYHHAEFSQGF
jgi:hypothetical protein